MATSNPYAAPQASSTDGTRQGRAHWLKWLFAAVAAYVPLLVAADQVGFLPNGLYLSLFDAVRVMPFLKGAVGLWWLYEAWQTVPVDERKLADGKPVTPGGVVGRMFIPIFGLYWMFAANSGLCAAINRVLASSLRVKSADATAAQLAAGGQIALLASRSLPYPTGIVLGAVVSGFWFWHMHGTDAAREQMEKALAERPNPTTA
jgi:hypothetical protein